MKDIRKGRVGHLLVFYLVFAIGFLSFLGLAGASHIHGPYNYITCDTENLFAHATYQDRYGLSSAIIDGDAETHFYYYRDEVRQYFDGTIQVVTTGQVKVIFDKTIDFVHVGLPIIGIGSYVIVGGEGFRFVAITMFGVDAAWPLTVGSVNFHTSSPTVYTQIEADSNTAHGSDSATLNTCT